MVDFNETNPRGNSPNLTAALSLSKQNLNLIPTSKQIPDLTPPPSFLPFSIDGDHPDGGEDKATPPDGRTAGHSYITKVMEKEGRSSARVISKSSMSRARALNLSSRKTKPRCSKDDTAPYVKRDRSRCH